MKNRCFWVDISKPDYIAYHDEEWGVPFHDDHKWFEFLTLEGAQAGLSWYTILKRRETYRQAFADFDPIVVSKFSQEQVETLLLDPGIIRNRLKVESTITNAQAFLKVQEEFGSFDTYIWRFVDGSPIINRPKNPEDYLVTTAESDALSKDLKKRGFKFVGSTICYALMQASGLVNDHSADCFCAE